MHYKMFAPVDAEQFERINKCWNLFAYRILFVSRLGSALDCESPQIKHSVPKMIMSHIHTPEPYKIAIKGTHKDLHTLEQAHI